MGRDYIAILGAASVISIVLAFLLILCAIIIPALLGGAEPKTGTEAVLKELLPVAAMLLIILGALFYIGVFFAAIYEIAVGKNEGEWKVIWAIALIVLGLIGLAVYLLTGRKELKR